MLRVKDGINSNSTTATTLQTARTINGTSFNGSSNITTANWGTARTLTIGNTGKSVNGSANVSWSLTEIGAAPLTHAHSTVNYTNLSSQTMSLNNLNLSSGFESISYFCCPTDGGGSGITGRPDDNNKTAFNLKVELLRWASTTDYISKQTYTRGSEKVSYVRYCTNGTWSSWEKIYTSVNKPTAAEIGAAASSHTHNYAGSSSAGGAANSALTCTGNSATATKLQTARTINGVSFDGTSNITITASANGGTSAACSGNAATATKLQTARTISLTGSVTGSGTFDGSGNLSISTSTNHTHSYLPLGGGTMTGTITSSKSTGTHLAGNQGTGAIINATAGGTGYNMLARMKSTNGVWTFGSYGTSFNFYYTADTVVSAGTNTVTKTLTLLNESGNSVFPGIISASGFSGNASTATKLQTARTINGVSFDGSANITITAAANGGTSSACSGNAATATTLQSARTINGTSFNGSANITTANWGTARTITIGNTAKSVNGSGNVSWTLAEIGAAATHSHPYLSTSGGSLSGDLTVSGNVNPTKSINIGTYEDQWRGTCCRRLTNSVKYEGRFGASYLSSVKQTSSDTASIAYGAAVECHNGTSTVRRVLMSQHSFIPMTDNNTYCGTSSHRWQALYASTGTVYSSSKDEKENITPLNIAPMSNNEKSIKDVIKNGIKNTNMYSYSYRTISNNDTFVGFLGQELEEQSPEFFNLIGSSYITEEGNQQYDIRETSVIGVLWSALQDAITENEQQEERINKLEEQLSKLIETTENK